MRTKSERLIRLFIELSKWDNVLESDVILLSKLPAKARRILRHLRKKAIKSPFEKHSCEGFVAFECGPHDDPERPTFYICQDGQRRFLSKSE